MKLSWPDLIFCQSLVTKPLEVAKAEIEEAGFICRVLEGCVTCEGCPSRVNLVVENNIVIKASRG